MQHCAATQQAALAAALPASSASKPARSRHPGAGGAGRERPAPQLLRPGPRPALLPRCRCVPDAALLGGGDLLFHQQALLPGSIKGRLYDIKYTAFVPQTGLQADCRTEICSVMNGAAKKPNHCLPFLSSNFTRNALVC